MADRLTGIRERRAQVEAARSAETAAETAAPIGEETTSAPAISEVQTAEQPAEKKRRKAAELRKERRVNWMTENSLYDALSKAAAERGLTVSAAIGLAVRDWLKKEASI